MSKLADEQFEVYWKDAVGKQTFVHAKGIGKHAWNAALRAAEQPSRDAVLEQVADMVEKSSPLMGKYTLASDIRTLKEQPAEPSAPKSSRTAAEDAIRACKNPDHTWNTAEPATTPSQEAKPVESGDGVQPNAPAPAAAMIKGGK